jgi:hypothetical protein
MSERKISWLINTCLLGLLPAIARLVVWLIYNGGIEPLATSDFVAFGLVLHSSNINEVNRIAESDEVWKIAHNGLSVIFIVIYALLLFTTIIPSGQINQHAALKTSILLSIVSFLLSSTIFFRSHVNAKAV